MSIPEPILLLGAERVGEKEAYLLPHLRNALQELTGRKASRTNREKPFIEIMEDGCWKWKRAKFKNGYGAIRVKGITYRSHRYFYEKLKGGIPQGLILDHKCRNRICCNPFHLKPTTIGINVLKGEGFSAINLRKTHCIRGHEFTMENTYITGKGRHCKPCENYFSLLRYYKKRGEK